ncbi:29500_t:CDS:2, partial [Racocetra persica]
VSNFQAEEFERNDSADFFDEYDNPVDIWVNDDMSNEYVNNDISDECNNLVNEDNTSYSTLPSRTNNEPKIPNLKNIKLVPMINCLVEVCKKNKNELCEHIMGSVDSLTGNYIGHLATRHERKRRLDQKFVELLIRDQQPISIRNDEGFKDFIAEFDPLYKFPSERYCRQLLSEAYDHTKQCLLNIFEKNIISCSLTCDLWTELRVKDLTQNDNELRIIVDIPTRWNSSYFAWQRLIKFQNIINLMITTLSLDEDYQIRKEDLTDDESNIVQDCTNFERQVKMALYKAINHYWQVPLEEGMLATLLDPQCKTLNFASESSRSKTYNSLREIYKQYQDQVNILSIRQPLQSTSKLLATMFRPNNAQIDEISDYIGIPEISYDQSTSTPSERLFSEAGNIMSIKRTSLLPITFEHLIFLKRNRHTVDNIFP